MKVVQLLAQMFDLSATSSYVLAVIVHFLISFVFYVSRVPKKINDLYFMSNLLVFALQVNAPQNDYFGTAQSGKLLNRMTLPHTTQLNC